jgi:hypothetical protein
MRTTGVSIGVFFTTLSTIDYSVAKFALGAKAPSCFATSLVWTHDFSLYINYAMAVLVPLIMINLIKEGLYGLFAYAARPLRHLIDVLNLAMMSAVLAVIVLIIAPVEGAIGPDSVVSLDTVESLRHGYLLLTLLNLGMLITPIVQWNALDAPAAVATEDAGSNETPQLLKPKSQ